MRPNLRKTEISGRKQKKWISPLHSACSNYWIPNSPYKKNFEFWDQISPKKVLSVKNEKSVHYHWTLHIRNSLGTKFQLKLTTLSFWKKLPKKSISRQKNVHHLWILHIRNSLGAKFHCNQTTLNFVTKFAQRGCFRP